MKKVTAAQKQLMSIGQHLGTVKSEVSQQIERYILGSTFDRSIFNVQLSEKRIREALQFLTQVRSRNGHVRIVATSPDTARIALQIFDKQRKDGVASLIVTRQIGGILTDLPGFIKSYVNKKVKPEYLKSPAEKRDQAINLQQREYRKLPTARIVRNVNDHGVAITEANDCMIPVIGFADTDCLHVEKLSYVIPGNTKSIQCNHQLMKTIAVARDETREREKKKEEEKVEVEERT